MSAFSAPWDSCRRARSFARPKLSKPKSKKSWAYYLAHDREKWIPVSRLRETLATCTAFGRCFGGRSQVGQDHAQKSAKAKRRPSHFALATLLEEILQQLPRGRFSQPAIDLRSMMAARRSKKLHAIFDGPALGVGSAIIEAANPCERQRGRAHGAGLERDVDVADVETLGAEPMGGVTDGDHLGVRRGVAFGQRAIAGARNHFLAAHQHTADRDLAASTGLTRLFEGHIHKRGHDKSPRSRLVPFIDLFIHGGYNMIRRSGCRFPACAKPSQRAWSSFDASAGEARSEQIMLKQNAKA